jgi:non-specific serine/threonine protein kinase
MRGWLALVAGDRSRARALLEECLALAEELGSVHAQAGARAGLGWAALAAGDREAATRHLRTGLDLAGRAGYRLGIAINLQGIARLAARGADRRRVARLAGAVESLGGVGRLLLTGPLLEAYEQEIAFVRSELGCRVFEAERASGLRLRLDLVVAEGLALVEAAEDRATSARAGSTVDLPRLTPKEMDVLRLLEKRLSNREIADALGLSTRTVETHVQHVCDKLGAKGRRLAVERAQQLGLL